MAYHFYVLLYSMNNMQHFQAIKSLLGDSRTYYLIAVGMDSNYSYLNKHYAEIFEPIHGV
jgi:hypothetical protein